MIALNKLRFQTVMNFENLVAILYFHMELAYDIIYKDRIIAYSMEGVKISDQQYETASKDFAALVIKMIGPTIHKNLIDLYGDDRTLLFNVIEYFNSKFEHDEIYKSAMDNIMNSEVDVSPSNNPMNRVTPDVSDRVAKLLGAQPLSGMKTT
jgi:hypothetical protein